MINIDHNPDRYNKKAFRNSYSAFRSNTIKIYESSFLLLYNAWIPGY
ncbi:hypothetical protein ZPR_3449 [Zunongwangia profunda SM-A87]|uniref:Uncharacterized protein n=1 Tax=Zunongwangia profunda (strain DSM 18752 / CCTCC AB 206139 / SM-A87) TaxID=655815 RepID=D5BJR7_ZUNPS|nr:hypothetical protein ZPR_3449 [Zunongwangia profunda SM-A87]